MVSREKTLAAAFQAPPEMPFPAFYGGYLDADLRDCVHSTAYGSFGSWGWFRMPPASVLLPHLGGYGRSVEGVVSDALCFCFAAAAVSKEWCQALSNCQGAAAKKERRSVRTGPGVSFRSRENTGGKTHGYYQSKTLVTGAASVPGEARNAAARAFFSYTIKRRILFFHGEGHPTKAQRSGFCGEEESGEAPPAAEKASRFRGSGAIGGPEGAGNRNAATVCKGATERYEGCPPPQGVPNIAQFDPTTNGGFARGGAASHRPSPHFPAPGTGAPPYPRAGKEVLKPPGFPGTPVITPVFPDAPAKSSRPAGSG